MTSPTGLNEYSQRFVAFIARVRPEWLRYARRDDQAVASEGAMVIELPPPAPGRPSLAVKTDGDWITVCFDRLHGKFHLFEEEDAEAAFQEAVDLVDALLREEVVVAVITRGDQWVQYTTLRAGDEPPAPPPGYRVYVVSWRGTWDQGRPATG